MKREIEVTEGNQYTRIDKFLRKSLVDIKLHSLYAILRKGDVRVNGIKIKKPDYTIQIGDIVEVYLPENPEKSGQITRDFSGKRKLVPRKIAITTIFEDESLIVIDKDSGIAIHPGEGAHQKTTLIEGLLFASRNKGYTPYLVHRLDKDTSGLIAVAKTLEAARILGETFRERNTVKKYYTMVEGGLERNELVFLNPLDGKHARTRVYVKKRYTKDSKMFTLLDVEIETGRKHQIRRHLSMNNIPILGDTLYGNLDTNAFAKGLGLNRIFLQSYHLEFPHPKTGKSLRFLIELDQSLKAFIEYLNVEA
jgi:23S rRNA pseudouridine955/2504/2580 synthase